MTALAEAIPRPRSRNANLVVNAILVVGGSLFIALMAQVTIPLAFTPVPISGQTFAVLLVGTAYGWRLAALTLALYLTQIAIGLPFAAEAKSGWEVLTIATASGGYLWGMLGAAILTGWLANRGWDRSFGSALGLMLLGNIVIFGVGVAWLAASIDIPVVSSTACDLVTGSGCDGLELGLYPFVIGDLLKLLLAAGLLPAAWKLTGKDRADR
ncbi:MAG TPA: biotin transporter BioY [Actinomycetota bacterium]|nr:biotin transporter BioY [Actinomycetota bacterium]